jgi:hypothetical protein
MTDRIRITPENYQKLIDEIDSGFWPEWMTATEISTTFHITRSQVNVWGQRGWIESKGTGKFFGCREQLVYNLIDLMHERVKRRSLKKRAISERPDGLYVECVDCKKLKHTDEYYKNEGAALGVSTRCRVCHLALGKKWEQENRDKGAAKRRRASRLSAARARAARSWEPPKLYPAQPVVEAVRERFGDTPMSEIERSAGVPPDSYRSIVKVAKSGGTVRVSTIESLLCGLDLTDEWARINAELEKDRPAWHPKHPYCVRCYRVAVPHHAAGLCRTCHRNRNKPGWTPVMESGWSLRYAHCVECKGTDSKHHARGLCDRCLQRNLNRERRAAELAAKVGYGHGNDGSLQSQEQAPDDRIGGGERTGRVSDHP